MSAPSYFHKSMTGSVPFVIDRVTTGVTFSYLPDYLGLLHDITPHFIPAFPIWSRKGLKNAAFRRNSYIYKSEDV